MTGKELIAQVKEYEEAIETIKSIRDKQMELGNEIFARSLDKSIVYAQDRIFDLEQYECSENITKAYKKPQVHSYVHKGVVI